jgi:SAM-dependent methyltransferase
MDPATMWSGGDYPVLGDRFAEASRRLAEQHADPGTTVLDVACGPGTLAIAAAKRGAAVTALDAAPRLLDAARQRADKADVDVRWIESDMTAMPLEAGSFDLVASAFGAMFAPEPEAMAAELCRVCAPGGTIVTLAWTPDSALGEMLPLGDKYMPEPPPTANVPRWAEPESVEELYAGLPVDVETERRSVDLAWADQEQALHEITELGPPMLAMRQAVEPLGRWTEVVEDIRALLSLHGREEDGHFVMPSAYLEAIAVKH